MTLSSLSTHQNPLPCFGSKIRFENPTVFNREFAANSTFNAEKQIDPLILGDAPYQSPDWQRYEQRCRDNQNSPHPIACYPWGTNSIRRAADIYTGAMITGSGGGITDGEAGVRFHFDRQPENLRALQASTELSPLKKPLSDQVNRLNAKRSALILGGNTSISDYKQDSRMLFDQLLGFLKGKRLHPSYFWGQNSTQDSLAQTRAYYTAQDDTWHILKRFKRPVTQTIEGPPRTIRELSRAFQDIHLAKQDTLYLGSAEEGGKPISATRLNLAVFIYHLPQKFEMLKAKIWNGLSL